MKIPRSFPKSGFAAAMVLWLACCPAPAVTLAGGHHGSTGLAFSNPFTVCGESYQSSADRSSSVARLKFPGALRDGAIWAPGGFSFDFSAFTSPSSGGSIRALSGLGVGKAFKKAPAAPLAVEPKRVPSQDPPTPGNGTEKVPDGGSTLLMLGASLAGLHGLSRFFRRGRAA